MVWIKAPFSTSDVEQRAAGSASGGIAGGARRVPSAGGVRSASSAVLAALSAMSRMSFDS